MFDVIVIGGGPSGAALAHFLSKRGFSVVVMERTKFPRYKTCAGAIPIILKDLIGEFPFERSFDNLILKRGEREWRLRLASPIVTVKREDFDSFMLNKALNSGAQVTFKKARLIKDNRVYVDDGSYEAKIIVGADGASSMVRKNIGIHYPRWVRTIEWELPLRADDFIIKIGPGPGYAWFWPKRDTVAFGAGGFGEPKDWALGLAKELALDIGVKESHYRYPVWRKGKRIEGNKILIGDAGAFASPITGAGIYSGILSATIAYRMIEKYLRYNEPLRDPYFREFHKNFMPAMYLSWVFYYMPGFLIELGKGFIEKYYGLEDCYYDILKSVWRLI